MTREHATKSRGFWDSCTGFYSSWSEDTFLNLFSFSSFGILMISANVAVSHHQLHGIVDCF